LEILVKLKQAEKMSELRMAEASGFISVEINNLSQVRTDSLLMPFTLIFCSLIVFYFYLPDRKAELDDRHLFIVPNRLPIS